MKFNTRFNPGDNVWIIVSNSTRGFVMKPDCPTCGAGGLVHTWIPKYSVKGPVRITQIVCDERGVGYKWTGLQEWITERDEDMFPSLKEAEYEAKQRNLKFSLDHPTAERAE